MSLEPLGHIAGQCTPSRIVATVSADTRYAWQRAAALEAAIENAICWKRLVMRAIWRHEQKYWIGRYGELLSRDDRSARRPARQWRPPAPPVDAPPDITVRPDPERERQRRASERRAMRELYRRIGRELREGQAIAVDNWPRNPTTPQEQRERRTPSTVTPRPTPGPTPGGLGCDMRRRYSATSCDPNNRPASPRGGPR